jgi:membrane fusion protein (multidrug efflux system)
MSGETTITTPISKEKRKPLLMLVMLLVAVGAIGGGIYYWQIARFFQGTDDAYVATNVIEVTPQVTGTVRAVNVRETEHVDAGQLLVELDASDAQIALDGAEAELARTVREVRTWFANNDTLAADVAVRAAERARLDTDVKKAEDDYTTRAALIATGAVGKEELKHAEAARNAARAALVAAGAAIAAAEERLAANRAIKEGTTIQHHPAVARAASKVREAYLAWARNRILAPIGGEIAKRAVQVGQRVQPGSNLLSVVPLDRVWVDANFKESQLRRMRVGQPVKLTADIYGDKIEYSGHVAGFSAGTGAVFALLPAQNATGNWIKVVQRVPVRVDLDHDQIIKYPLRVGLSMVVEVDVHDVSGPALMPATPMTHVTRTDIFDGQADAADVRIKDIIAANLGSAKSDLAASP